jgi:hypothetical protein
MSKQRGCIVKYTSGGLFVMTRATTSIVLHYSFPKYSPKKITKENTMKV